jgi:hypothetical protein
MGEGGKHLQEKEKVEGEMDKGKKEDNLDLIIM